MANVRRLLRRCRAASDERFVDRVALARIPVDLGKQRGRKEGLDIVNVDFGSLRIKPSASGLKRARGQSQTHLARELFDADRDAVGLSAVLDVEVADAVLDEIAKKEADDLFVVGSDAEVLPVE